MARRGRLITMRLRHTATSMVAVGALIATGCGSVDSDEQTSALPPVASTIEIPADFDLAQALDPSAPAVHVPRVDGLTLPTLDAQVWVMSSEPSSMDEARALASALGVDPDRAEISSGGFGSWGAPAGPDGSDRLMVTDALGPRWDLVRSESVLGPPPTADEVDAAAQRLIEYLGVPASDVTVRSDPVGPTTGLTIVFAPGGHESDTRWNVTVGASGVVVDGNGALRAPQPAIDSTLVDLDEVMARLGRQIARVPGQIAPPPTTMLTAPATTMAPILVDGQVVNTVRPPSEIPGPVEVPVIELAEPALVTVWDTVNRTWLVPAVRLTAASGFSVVIAAVSADSFRIVDRASSSSDPQVTVAPLTIPGPPADAPMPTVPPPTTTTTTTTTTSVPGLATQPHAASTTTDVPATGPTLPRPTLPGSNVTLVLDDGTPITVPIPPDPNEVDPSRIPTFYAESINAMLIGRSLDEAEDLLRRTGWSVRLDDLDDPTETFTADLRVGRVTIGHRDGTVVSVTVG